MTIRASRGRRLLVAAALAWLGLALCAQAAHATYSKITIVKINQGGDQNDTFTFDTHLTPSPSPSYFSIKAGEAYRKTFQVECNAQSACTQQWGQLTQTISERPASGYTLTGVTCRHTGSSTAWGSEPTTSSALDPDTTFDAASRKIDFKLDWYEWTKCWVTNTRDTGTIKVIKKVVAPAGDTGRFNLLVDGQAKATNIGDAGTTGAVAVLPGTHTVAESAGTGTDLANYTASLSCKDTAHANAADDDGTLDVHAGDAWECVITNTRKTTPPPTEPPTTTPPATPPTTPTTTTTQPKIQVSPARVRPGSAKLSGPSGCPTTSAIAATVTGRRIVKVTFYVDGKKVKTLTKANRSGGGWGLPLNVRALAFRAHGRAVSSCAATASRSPSRAGRP